MAKQGKSSLLRIIILVLVFVIPIIILVFLKTQGTHYFELPVFYQEGSIDSDPSCTELEAPYHLDYPAMGILEPENFPALFMFFTWTKGDEIPNRLNILSRIRRNFEASELSILIIYEEDRAGTFDALFRKYELADSWNKMPIAKEDLMRLSRCEFVNKDMHWVMADARGRIRGYYDMTDEREQERLIVEVKILKEETDE